ncbi:hypothetical protein KVR01_006109 [Diaporthe batatas]|uniref:uncharacterized protein n=1 Tax=Diaporthe batatas TaxID=748121 RepID=UPI001D03FE5C|nr:uncharacterized protein KVR01_006109 [Diaporthe batatas]KAG8164191.1 hypothetical protein KVR01_006109 [Diaporthe batatas]
MMSLMASGKTALVIGANRGIGLQLIKTFKERGWHTIGSVRPDTLASNDPSIEDLKATGSDVVELDLKSEQTIKETAQSLVEKNVTIDVLFLSAGIGVYPLEWQAHEKEDLMERFEVMVVGPLLTVKHFLPLINKDGTGKIAYMTSSDASVGANDGDAIGYRMTKSAENQQMRTLSIDFKKAEIPISTLAFEPGFIKTRLTRWKGHQDIVESCNGMVDIVERMTPDMLGSFLKWNGETIPW